MARPAAASRDYEQVFQDPQVLHRRPARGHPRPADADIDGMVSTIASPLRLRDARCHATTCPRSRLGDSTEAVLGALLGYTAERIAELRARRIA